MTLSWTQLDDPDDARRVWREIGARCGYATFFHTRAWADAFCACVSGWQPEPVVVEFTDGNVAVLPMLRRLDSELRQSMAPYVYGGPLFMRAPEQAHWDEVGKIPLWYSDIVLYDNPFSPDAWELEGLVRWKIHTHVLDLSPGFDRVFAGYRRMIRQHCRGAEKAGVSVAVAKSLEEVDAYYDAYVDSLTRWGDAAIAHYPRSLFHELFGLQEEDRGVRFWLASIDDRIISGVLVLYHGEHAVAWHAATRSEHLSSHASPFVHTSAIRSACADGFRWYDFNPSGHLRGVEFFKESFGAERRRFAMYHSATFTHHVDWTSEDDAQSTSSSVG